ncbi:amidohydrolase family protein [Paludibaculum fermentans]|uniref:Amidohydrolase family protein n=1 Tax=Paludibaculum fermentans TaxID=1473598 RepID=A0A7S7NUR3_PALFE|nr:amidohydrolase family protein [Paludibaculum fermentans]QOY90101.1 amidohydrolase family protein [Paludibaculum fermentans]
MQRRTFFTAGLAAACPAILTAQAGSFKELSRAIDAMPLVDSHEHLLPESERLELKPDLFLLASHYLNSDMVSAGMPTPTPKTWAEFEPWWQVSRFTGYGQALSIAIRDIYGIGEIKAATLPRINSAIAEANKPGLYKRILKDRMKLDYAVLDDYWHGDPVRPDGEYFVLARKMDWFCSAAKAADIRRMEEVTGTSIPDVKGLKRAVEKRLDQSLDAGLVTIKSTLAYNRPLRFEVVPEADAQRDFDLLMKEPQKQAPRRLSDHIFHHVLQLADAHKLPVQMHTGLQAGNGNTLENSRPTLLNNLFGLYPKVVFDLFHLGWPWMEEVAALAKMYANVTADLCWVHIITPTGARRALHELIDTVPLNKILGFGGDYRYVELSYAHAVMARRNVAQVLAEKVQSREMTEAEALNAARLILHDNAARLFPRPKPRQA